MENDELGALGYFPPSSQDETGGQPIDRGDDLLAVGETERDLEWFAIPTKSIPLEAYKDRSFYTMRTDAYDRFCTSLEQRFTRAEIETMLASSGFDRIEFSEEVPFWCAVARRR